ncbi:MAG TPA: DNA/RNA nuclease SfsA, partial [Mobilitalea sp.]|nr:DNA/RNA nuclease SfsA [Mobilitalea sp.]
MKLNYNIRYGTFIGRPNRFIAHIDIDGEQVISHVPNTGRLKELLVPGAPVIVSYHPEDSRKTKYELRMVKKKDSWVSIDSQLPNALAYEAVAKGLIKELSGYSQIKKEVTYQNSRFDLQLTDENGQICFVEVKGVTLEKDGWSYFPDAPTERGRKHIDELIHAAGCGYKVAL